MVKERAVSRKVRFKRLKKIEKINQPLPIIDNEVIDGILIELNRNKLLLLEHRLPLTNMTGQET